MAEQRPVPTEDDDTSGHHMYSDRNIKEDVQPVSDEEEGDTSGHHLLSDRNIKEDVQPVSQDDEE